MVYTTESVTHGMANTTPDLGLPSQPHSITTFGQYQIILFGNMSVNDLSRLLHESGKAGSETLSSSTP